MNKIITVNGILMASQDELNAHVENGTAHVTEEERAAWNAKADTSGLVSKVDVETFNAHKGDDAVHITEKDRNSWNGKQDKLTDEEGNLTLAGGMTVSRTVNANGGINIPGPPVTDTDAARLHEVRVLNEIANGDAGNYFGFSTVPFGKLLSPHSWHALYWPKPSTDNGWVDFSFRCNPLGQDMDRGGSYTGATGIFLPLSCCLGYHRMFNVVAGGIASVTLNDAWFGPDDHPFSDPTDGILMWWDVYFMDRDPDNKIPVRGRFCRFNHTSGQVELLTKMALLPDNFRLRGIAIAWGLGHGGMWIVGCNGANGGRLEAYRICDDTWSTSSYHSCINNQCIRLLCNRNALEVGVGPLKTYVGTYGQKNIVAEWCEMMEVK